MTTGSTEVLYEGKYHSVEFLKELDGTCPAKDFLDRFGVGNRQHRKRERIKAIAKLLGDSRPGSFINPGSWKKIEDDLFELRANQLRVLFCFEQGRVIVICGEQKKNDKLNKNVLERARRLRDTWKNDGVKTQ